MKMQGKTPPTSYGSGMDVKTGKYGGASTPKGTAVNGSFNTSQPPLSHRKTTRAPKFKGHQFSKKKM